MTAVCPALCAVSFNCERGLRCKYGAYHQFSSVHSVVSYSWRPHEPQQARPPCPSPTPGVYPNPGPFKWISCSRQVAKVLQLKLQHQSFQWTPRPGLLWDGLVGSPCSPRDSQGSLPAPQFKSISSSALSFLYGPTLTSIHDYWKNHSLD